MTAPCRFDSPYHCYEHDGYTNKAAICHIGLDELRVKLEAASDAYKAGYRKAQEDLEATVEEQAQKLDAIATWTPISARACPMCVYREGRFVEPCAWHQRIHEQAQRIIDLENSMKGHFQRDHLEGDGPEIDQWKRKMEEQKRVIGPLSRFYAHVVEHFYGGGCDFDGGDFQDCAEKFGLLRQEPYDPVKHGEDSDCEPGDPYFVQTDIGKQSLSPEKEA